MQSLKKAVEEQNLRINRNIVECKYVIFSHNYNHTPELIETLWNVNSKPTSHQKRLNSRINRNIVECK